MISEKAQKKITSYVEALRTAAEKNDFDNALAIINLADHLFGGEIAGIHECLEEVKYYNGTFSRNARTVAELLDFYLLKHTETNNFFDTTLEILIPYPKAHVLYDAGLGKFREGIFERNTLDDMRAALEQLVMHLTGSKQTLENQIRNLGDLLKEEDVKPHARNMFTTLISYYTNYQNDYIKHHSLVDSSEVGFIVEITSALMRYLIVIFGNADIQDALLIM